MDLNRYTPHPDDIKNIYLTIQFELLKQFKRKRILITTILALLIPLLFFVPAPPSLVKTMQLPQTDLPLITSRLSIFLIITIWRHIRRRCYLRGI